MGVEVSNRENIMSGIDVIEITKIVVKISVKYRYLYLMF